MNANLFEKEARTRSYGRTVTLIMLKAFEDVVGKDNINEIFVEFTVGTHLFIRPSLKIELTNEIYKNVWTRMHDYIDANLPIEKVSAKVSDLYAQSIEEGNVRFAEFLHFRTASRITLTKLDDFTTYFYGSVYRWTGAIKSFDIMPYDDGFFILMPDVDEPDIIPHFEIPERLYQANCEAYRVSHNLDADTLTDVNKLICQNKVTDLILTWEAVFDSKLAKAASDIINKNKKFVFLAGPSSSGKTSTANRLCYALRSYGKIPHIISLDDYYKSRKELRANGVKIDIESVEALDVELFKADMKAMLGGETVEIPHFNFINEEREYIGNTIEPGENHILIIEGIHSLNGIFSEGLPEEVVYKIYASALSQINIDEHNRIPSSDIRLLRRIVRDNRTRGYTAAMTIDQWPNVRDGEEANIFPFQNTADCIIDTAMVYEIAAIKPYAERALFMVERDTKEYCKARELLKFLNFVVPLSTDLIPPHSIIREFIGGSCLNVG